MRRKIFPSVNQNRRRLLRMLAAVVAIPFVGKSGWGGAAENLPFHHLPNGEFRNNFIGQINKPFADLLKWRREAPVRPLLSFPLAANDSAFLRDNRTQNTITWIGHSTLLLQIGGANILTDPHFSERASPFSFAGPKRGTPPGININDLPKIDAVVISHNHYDHLDSDSIKMLARKNPAARFFCPLKNGEFLSARGARDVRELDWGEFAEFNGVRFTAAPCQHWSSRFPWDRNRALWAAWILESPSFRFLFVGDTGYSPDFAALGEKYGGFDWAAIPVGAYEPRWFMRQAHIDGREAAQIYLDTKTKNAVGIHWGVFQLTDEPMDEPPQKLRQAAAEIGAQNFHLFQHGETRVLDS